MPAQSKSQQRFFGVVKAMQKGDIPKKGKAGKIAKQMTKKDVDDFASTKHKGKPEKVKREMKVRNLIKKMVREELAQMDEKVTGQYKVSPKVQMHWGMDKVVIISGNKRVVLNRKEMKSLMKGVKANKLTEGTCGYGENGQLGEEPAGPHLIKKKKMKEEVEPIGGMSKIAKIVKDKQHAKVGGQTVDMQSANLLMKLYNAVKDKDKEKMNKMSEKKLIMVLGKLWSRVKLKLPT